MKLSRGAAGVEKMVAYEIEIVGLIEQIDFRIIFRRNHIPDIVVIVRRSDYTLHTSYFCRILSNVRGCSGILLVCGSVEVIPASIFKLATLGKFSMANLISMSRKAIISISNECVCLVLVTALTVSVFVSLTLNGSLGCNLHPLTISVATTTLLLKLQQLSSRTLSVYHFYIQSCIK